MAWEKIKRLVYRKKEMPSGLWMRCEKCGTMVFKRKVEELYKICPQCGFHFYINSEERLRMMLDKDSFKEEWADLITLDPLEFKAKVAYADKLVSHRKKSGLNEACVTGTGKLYGQDVVVGVLDFRFCGASMGSVVGEKLTRAIELATTKNIPLILISCSGGARMEEGALSLMQMAKTSAALARMTDAGGLYISILTHPTTGGVSASYAALGDVILAEPGALIGFAGPRVISETIKEELPAGFQTAEFLLEHGFVDRVVHRSDIRKELVHIIGYLFKDYDPDVIKRYEQVDKDEHEEWLRAHETQRIDKQKEEAPEEPVAPAPAAQDTAGATPVAASPDVDQDNLGPDMGGESVDIVHTSGN